jgi:quercetin dioxygenase-like cupin family protein
MNTSPAVPNKPNYTVKESELILAGENVRARVITLAPDQSIPWHYHSESTDYNFVLSGTLSIKVRNQGSQPVLKAGERYQLPPGTAHLLLNGCATDCQFLLLQGVGKYD